MTELPYDAPTLAAIVAAFNQTWWFAVLAGLAASAWIVRAMLNGATLTRHACFAVAGMSLVVAGPYLMGSLAPLDFMAPVYAGLWLLNALIFAILGARGGIAFAMPSDRAWPTLASLAIAALYPVAFWIETEPTRGGLALPGSYPDATAILVIAMLSATTATDRPPLLAVIVPIFWAGIAAFNGYLLGLFTPMLVAVAMILSAYGVISRR